MRLWIRTTVELPPKDQRVLVYHEYAPEPIWLGYHDGEQWRYADGGSCQPLFWSAMPVCPGVQDTSPVAKLLEVPALTIRRSSVGVNESAVAEQCEVFARELRYQMEASPC